MRTLQQSFKPGDRVLLKATHGGKFNLPGEEVEVVEQLNQQVIKVRNSRGKIFTAAIHRCAPIKAERQVTLDIGTSDEIAVEDDANDGTVPMMMILSKMKLNHHLEGL